MMYEYELPKYQSFYCTQLMDYWWNDLGNEIKVENVGKKQCSSVH